MTYTFEFEALGSWFGIKLPEANELLKRNIIEWVKKFDSQYSRFIPTSIVAKISQKPGRYKIGTDGVAMLTIYFDLFEATQGKFNPLIGNLLSDLGYDAEYSLKDSKKRSIAPNLLDTLKILDGTTIETSQKVCIDFGALGKGYAVDAIAQLINDEGYRESEYIVNGSGDMYVHSLAESLKIGLEDPNDTTKAIGIARLDNGALCGSGSNRRAWGEYHHIVNPFTQSSPKNILATWVWASSTAISDALATCLFLVQPEDLSKYHYEYVILYSDYSIQKSSKCPAELFV